MNRGLSRDQPTFAPTCFAKDSNESEVPWYRVSDGHRDQSPRTVEARPHRGNPRLMLLPTAPEATISSLFRKRNDSAR